MKCSICGMEGHNSRTCCNKQEELRDQALWMKVDGLTEKEASDLQAKIIKDKSDIAPKARGTFCKANAKDLPDKITNALKCLGDKNVSEKK